MKRRGLWMGILVVAACGPLVTTPISVDGTTLEPRSVAYASCRGERALYIGTEEYTRAVFLVGAVEDVCAQVPAIDPCAFGCTNATGTSGAIQTPVLQVVADLPDTVPFLEAHRTRLAHHQEFSWRFSHGLDADRSDPIITADEGTLQDLQLSTEHGQGRYEVIVDGVTIQGTLAGSRCPALEETLSCPQPDL